MNKQRRDELSAILEDALSAFDEIESAIEEASE